MEVANGQLWVTTFQPSTNGTDGSNRVLRFNAQNLQSLGNSLTNAGTDYVGVDFDGARAAITAAGSGAVILADALTGNLSERVALNTVAEPPATPQDAAFILNPGGAATKLYVVDRFRETVRVVGLQSPATLGPEIALGYAGAPRLPMSGALSAEEDGEWLFRSVAFFNGSAAQPNPVTCQTCHTDGASDNIPRRRQPQSLFEAGVTAPYNAQGTSVSLLNLIRGAFTVHGKVGGPLQTGFDQRMLTFFQGFSAPQSPALATDGSLSSRHRRARRFSRAVRSAPHAMPHRTSSPSPRSP